MPSAIAIKAQLLAASLVINASFAAASAAPSEAKQPAARPDCSARVSILPTYDDRVPGTVRHDKLSLSATCTIMLLPGLTAEGTAYDFPIASQQQRWDPDFSFAAQYVLTPNTWLRYSNYTGNRWPWHDAPGNGSLARGTIAAYVALPSRGAHFPSCNVSLSVAPQFERHGGGDGDGKTWLSVACNVTAGPRLTFGLAASVYPFRGQQQPWDPDFTYTASLAVTPQLSLKYENYAGNRFPGHAAADTRPPSVGDGNISVVYALKF